MAFVAIPNNDQYEYDNAPPDPGVGHPMRALWLKSSNGIRTEHGHSNYVRTRKIGSGDVDHGELSKSYWDARGTEDDIQPFAMTVRTTAANEAFTIPCQNVGTFNATVDWGDGSSSTVTTYNDSNLAHTYASAGDHAISISGTFPNIKFGNNQAVADKVIAVTNLGQVGWQTLERAFKYCDNMTSFTSGVTDTSSVTNVFEMFYACSDMTSCDVSNFDTSSVTTMGGMFRYCYDVTSLDISSFDTSSVTNMNGTFWSCRSLTSLDVSNFDTSSVTNMYYMFLSCSSLTSLDISNFDTSSVTTMGGMFYRCSSLTDVVGVENFDIEGINTVSGFQFFMTLVTLPTARYDALLVNWDAQDPLDNLVPTFGNSKYTAGGTAAAARANLISTDGWSISDGGTAPLVPFAMTARTTAASETFELRCLNAGTFNATIDWGDGSSSTVTTYNDSNLAHTYASAGDHSISISGTFPNIFFNNTGVHRSKVIAVTNLGQVGWQSFDRAFYGCDNMTSFTSGVTDTSAVAHLKQMFYNCSNLTSVDLSTLNTSSTTHMNHMFYGCGNLAGTLNLSSLDTSSVTTMRSLFGNCFKLTTVNVSNWDTSSVTDMQYMFYKTGRDTTGTFDVVGIENFNIEGLSNYPSIGSIMQYTLIPTARYDALLINWDAQDPFDGMHTHFGSSQYTAGGAAAAARANLISTDGWTITDGGTA